MADPKTIPGTLYINGDRDYRTGARGPYVKIGIVRNKRESADRNREHQTGNPREVITLRTLTSPMVEHLETQLHHRFAPLWVCGEWFEMDDSYVESVVIPEAERIIAEQEANFGAFAQKRVLKTTVSSGQLRQPIEAELALWRQAVEAKERLVRAEAVKACADFRIRRFLGSGCGIDGIARLVKKTIAPKFDRIRFEREHPDAAAQFLIPTQPKVAGSIRLAGARSLRALNPDLFNEHTRLKRQIPTPTVGQFFEKPLIRNREHAECHNDFIQSLRDVAEAGWLWARLQTQCAISIGLDDGIDGCMTWSRVKKKQYILDTETLRQQHPELYAEYLKPGTETLNTDINFHRPYPI